MQNNAALAQDELRLEFPLGDDPYQFIEYTTLVLSFVNNASELDFTLRQLCGPQSVSYIDRHKNKMSVLGPIIANTVKRAMFEEVDDGHFPLTLFFLMTYFQEWGWTLTADDSWKETRQRLSEQAENIAVESERFWPTHLRLLVIDALFDSTEFALSNFFARIKRFEGNANFTAPLFRLGIVLGQCGWQIPDQPISP